ncbi:MAG: hypothetical protein IJ093_04410 [Bacilli bacterium]|nr:hypothetical protein [Bacilli bacterium]
MINEENITLITLADGTKWLKMAETVYNNETYKYVMGVTADGEDITEEVKVLCEYTKDGIDYVEFIEDQEILKVVIPMLVPEAKEYLDNPEKLKELV